MNSTTYWTNWKRLPEVDLPIIDKQKKGKKSIKQNYISNQYTLRRKTLHHNTIYPANRTRHRRRPPAESPRQSPPTDSRRAIAVATKAFKAILVIYSRSISEKVKTVKACSPYPLRSPGIPLGQSSRHLFHLVEYFPDAIEHLRQSLRVHARGLLTVTALFVQC